MTFGKEQINVNYIFSTLIIIISLVLYMQTQSIFIILLILLGFYGLVIALYVDKGYNYRLFYFLFFFILFSAGLTLIYLLLTTHYLFFIIFLIIIYIASVTFMGLNLLTGWLKISQFNKGAKLLDQHRYKEGFDYFDKILSQNSKNLLALAGKASAFQKLGKTAEALKLMENALDFKLHKTIFAKNSRKALVLHTAGVIYSDLKNYEKALEYTDESLKLNKVSYSSLNNKGYVLYKLGKQEEALVCLNKALRYDHKHVYALDNKGDLLRKFGKYQEAMNYADKALKINPEIPNFWLTKGQILMCLDKDEEALKYIDKALKLDPDFEDAIEVKEKLLILRN